MADECCANYSQRKRGDSSHGVGIVSGASKRDWRSLAIPKICMPKGVDELNVCTRRTDENITSVSDQVWSNRAEWSLSNDTKSLGHRAFALAVVVTSKTIFPS